jgi:PII-like signaling protein
MKGYSLRFYMREKQRHRGEPLHEWLLAEAKRRGIAGGSAFRAIAGFGRHGAIAEEHFFELAGELTVLVEFLVSEAEADLLLRIVREDGAKLFYARFPAEFGLVDGESAGP